MTKAKVDRIKELTGLDILKLANAKGNEMADITFSAKEFETLSKKRFVDAGFDAEQIDTLASATSITVVSSADNKKSLEYNPTTQTFRAEATKAFVDDIRKELENVSGDLGLDEDTAAAREEAAATSARLMAAGASRRPAGTSLTELAQNIVQKNESRITRLKAESKKEDDYVPCYGLFSIFHHVSRVLEQTDLDKLAAVE